MAEKSAAKKDQGKNKKPKQNDRKKNQENGTKHHFHHEESVPVLSCLNQKKKDKKNKFNGKTAVKKKSESSSFLKGFFKFLFLVSLYASLFLGFLYVVDHDRFVAIKSGAGALTSKVADALPKEMTSALRKGFEFASPAAEFVYEKSKSLTGHVSHFLNTNSAVKDHWINVREICSFTSARMVEYVRTLYSHATGIIRSGKK